MRVRFLPRGVELDVRRGERLLDVADDHPELRLPTACRAGNCGACLVRVVLGAEGLADPGLAERSALSELGATSDLRLGCQLALRADPGVATELIVLVTEPA